jgi:dihydrofolate reductase
MRRVIYGAACSVDGFMARRDDGVDWLNWSDDVAELSRTSLQGVDTIVMGRRTWEVARDSGTPAYPGYHNIVFSRTLAADSAPGVDVVADDPVAYVRELKSEAGGGICVMGGGLLAGALLDGDLVDVVGLNIHPILLGDGIPMFTQNAGRIGCELIESRPIANGCVYALYRVIPRTV